ncbi:hypothetical protein Tco_1033245 [Tanacetum coccineum]|uniref:Uncharacterized protein n=1 Tax=Tanacetum coccineum TaxID=301880 RepID=A0ABQ5GEC5_9ASTR
MSAHDDFSLHDDEELSLHDDASLAGSLPASNKGDAPAKPPQNFKPQNTFKHHTAKWELKKRVTKVWMVYTGFFLQTTKEEQLVMRKERKASNSVANGCSKRFNLSAFFMDG